MTRLLLASQSPARLKTLRAAGIEPIVQPSGVDEDAVLEAATDRHGPLDAAEIALLLARAKAEAIADTAGEDALVLGCDSVLEFEGEIFGKPADAAAATERWKAMRGNLGTLHTGHWLVYGRDDRDRRSSAGETASTTVHFAEVTEDEIEAYVATGEPLNVAGAFTVDGFGAPFITGIEGDFHNVVGISLPLLRRLVADLGLAITDLWLPTSEIPD